LLESLNIPYKESGKNVGGGWIGTHCPFCQDSNYHLGINLKSKTISCWKCGQTGTIISFLSKETGSFPESLKIIKEYIPRELQYEEEKSKTGVKEVVLPESAKPGLSKYHKNYLRKRKFNPEYLEEKYHLHHTGPVGVHKNCIIIPVMRNMQLLTYTTINIHDDAKVRYLHLAEELSIIPVKKLLYGDDYTDGFNVIVVEGIFDFWRIGDGCVPAFGVKFTADQKRLLARYANVKVLGDGDKEGWKFNRSLAAELSPFCNVRYFDLDEGVDPDQLTKEEIKYIKGA
jgi:DNA primase